MSTKAKTQFKHVSYLWDDKKAEALAGDEVGLLIYRSNLLGADLRLTNYGGGNTSCKAMAKNPLTGEETVELFNHCIYDLASKAPSIDTPLHAFLPFKHVDHLHPDAAIAIAAAKDGKKITQELFNGTIGWVEWQKPGFDLGLKLKQCLDEHPGIRGIMLGSHGLFTWGDTAYESYINTLEVIERCAQYLEDNYGKKSPVFGGEKIRSLSKEERLKRASSLAPVLRGFCSSYIK